MSKFRSLAILLAASLILPLSGCAARTDETVAGGENIHVTDDGVYYTFQNMEGEKFKAPLLNNVPKCKYDFPVLRPIRIRDTRGSMMRRTGSRHIWESMFPSFRERRLTGNG